MLWFFLDFQRRALPPTFVSGEPSRGAKAGAAKNGGATNREALPGVCSMPASFGPLTDSCSTTGCAFTGVEHRRIELFFLREVQL